MNENEMKLSGVFAPVVTPFMGDVPDLDALTYAGSMANLADLAAPDRHLFVQGDICDQSLVSRLIREHAIDTIVHFAAESHVDRSIHGPARFFKTNIVGTFSLLEAARDGWLGRRSSAPGARVEAAAFLRDVEGRRLTFAVTAREGARLVARGTIRRVVVDRARFLESTLG